MSKHYTIHVPKGFKLTLTTDSNSSGRYVYLGNPGQEAQSSGNITTSQSVRIGPFNEARDYDIVSETGEIVRALEFSGNYTKEDETEVADYLARVDNLDDLPVAVNGVITLSSNKAYMFTNDLDLMGNRLVGGANTAILGTSSETSSITSTGLGDGTALFTTTGTTPIQNITFKDVDTLFDISGTGAEAYDWTAVNFVSIPNLGTIENIDNWIFTNCSIIDCLNLTFDGTAGTLGMLNCLISSTATEGNVINVPATATILRRIRFIYSSVVLVGDTVGITVNASATIPTEGFILDTLNFSGGGDYLGGLDDTSNTSLFVNCIGITNTSVNGQAYMQDNSTVTTIAITDTWYKALGTTTASPENDKYAHSNNRLTNQATIERRYLVQATISFTTGNNRVCAFGFYDSKLADIRTPSQIKSTANGNGRAENVTLTDVVSHSSGDYIEVHCQNTTNTDNITVTDLNIVITEIV